MLKLSCRTEEGLLIFECSHVEPQRLWATIVAAFQGYYKIPQDFIYGGPGCTICNAGITLGSYSVSSAIVSGCRVTVDNTLSVLAQDIPVTEETYAH